MEKVQEIYYDNFNGAISFNNLWYEIKDQKIKITKKKLKEWYDNQPINEIFKKPKDENIKISCQSGIGCIQADLMDMKKFPKNRNKGFVYLLVVVDVHSRFIWLSGLKKKSPNEILPVLKKVREQVKLIRKDESFTLTTDDGSEFKGVITKWVNTEKIKHYIANPKDNTKNRTYIVERVNRTILDKLKKMLEVKNDNKWADNIEKIEDVNNNTIHSSTKQKPNDIMNGKEEPKYGSPFGNPFDIKENFEIGDNVRVLTEKSIFDKKSLKPTYTKTVYKIIKKDGNRFMVQSLDTMKSLRKGFLPSQMIKTVNKTVSKEKEDEIKEHKKKQKIVRKNRKTGLDTDEEGNIIIPKNMKPKNDKRISTKISFK